MSVAMAEQARAGTRSIRAISYVSSSASSCVRPLVSFAAASAPTAMQTMAIFWRPLIGRPSTVVTLAISAAAYAVTPAAPPPIANYWVDVATSSGLGAGMSPGSRPNLPVRMPCDRALYATTAMPLSWQ